ncbi:ABC transporter ATP-binding protein [Sulfobacillus sp. hq2]|uniref:ABC transporter ATP-binding protein n=1 Tax=Sulfobacillus TaxID=28033 RepID=UPI000CD04B55|nr:ABC transporter ATP-binding protein [Sulfobacillus sp. hq2]POB11302.1 ABC transporter ATP-binding protein [Sulfobacillus sp. hq2]
MSREPLLLVDKIVKTFGGFKALDGVSLQVAPGEILGLVGPNGSGKTTLINVISGLYRPDGGLVQYQGRTITNWPMHRRARHGINRTFQIPKPFKTLTVAENVELAHHFARPGAMTPREVLEFTGLADAADRLAQSLNSSQQKLLDLARALTTGPELVLVDELAAGLGPHELHQMADSLRHLADRAMALIVVEHHLGFVNQLTDRVIVMNAGKEIFEGSLALAAQDPIVSAVYLGNDAVDVSSVQ